MKEKDFSSSGLKLEGQYENDRNADSSDLFKDMIREAFDVQDVIIGHHLIYEKRDPRNDGFTYDVVQEIPSADALIFDTDIAQKLFGSQWQPILTDLATTPIAQRDAKLRAYYYNPNRKTAGGIA